MWFLWKAFKKKRKQVKKVKRLLPLLEDPMKAYLDVEQYNNDRQHLEPSTRIAGDFKLGYYGVVSSDALIDGETLAQRIGLEAGVAQCSQAGWFKYQYEGCVRYVAIKPLRHSLSWLDLFQAGAVYGQDEPGLDAQGVSTAHPATITLKGIDYRVKLMQGARSNPAFDESGSDVPASANAEWNRVFYRLHGRQNDGFNRLDSEHIDQDWGAYTDREFLCDQYFGNGTACWTQEQHGSDPNNRVIRGFLGISDFHFLPADTRSPDTGWRPVLEPIL